MDWQPIETAPRDGTWILLRGARMDDDDYHRVEQPKCVVAHWRPDEDDCHDDWTFAYFDGGFGLICFSPTAWQPLPPLPEA
jgi:hypothetical protein